MRAIFCDHGRLQGMLDFEAALARAEARVGVIPANAVAPITAACRAELYDFEALAQAICSAGNSAIPLVKALGKRRSPLRTPRPSATCIWAPPARTPWTAAWSCNCVLPSSFWRVISLDWPTRSSLKHKPTPVRPWSAAPGCNMPPR